MNKKVIYFLFATFLITGLGWGSLYFLSRAGNLEFGEPLFMILFAIAGFGPTFAPFIALALTEKKAGFKEYGERLFRFKISPGYYLLILVILILLGLVPALVQGDGLTKLSSLAQISWQTVPILFLSSFFLGGLEELGWRGFLQHELHKKYSIGFVTLIVWVLWSLWHVPLFFIPGVSQFGQNFWVFSVYALFFSLILGWFYGRTHSIPIAILGHTLINTLAALGYLNFLENATIHWATLLIVTPALVGLYLVFPVKKTCGIESSPSSPQ